MYIKSVFKMIETPTVLIDLDHESKYAIWTLVWKGIYVSQFLNNQHFFNKGWNFQTKFFKYFLKIQKCVFWKFSKI